MTNEEAIAIIHQEYLCVNKDCDIERNCGKCDLAMPSKQPILEAYKMAIKVLGQEPCDCISRAELLKAVDTWDKFGCDADTKLVPVKDCYVPYIHYDDVVKAIKGMPSVQPKPKTDVLDKIRAEIIDTGAYEQEVNGKTEFLKGINYCLGVIDKYKSESENRCIE